MPLSPPPETVHALNATRDVPAPTPKRTNATRGATYACGSAGELLGALGEKVGLRAHAVLRLLGIVKIIG